MSHGGSAHDGLRTDRIDAFAVLAPCADILACLAAVGLGASVERGQFSGFVLAVLLNVASLVRGCARGNLHLTLGRVLGVLTATLLAYFLRSGVLGLLIEVCRWPSQAAIAVGVLVAAATLRLGYAYFSAGASLVLGRGDYWRAGAIGLIVYAALLRLVYCGQIDLLPTEAYYWNYSRHLDVGYLDHPPMVAWLIRAGTAAFGNTEFGVRVGALGVNAISTFFVYRLTRNLFGRPSALLAVLLLQTLPFFFTSGMVMTPDAPLTAAWAASLYYLERALIGGRRGAWWGAGLCLGLGMLSKYTIVLVAGSTGLYMLVDARARVWWRRIEPYGAVLLALAIFAPVIHWNAEHEWASFAFQGPRRLAEPHRFSLHWFIASTLVLLTPVGFLALAGLLRRQTADSTTGAPPDPLAWRFLQFSVAVPIAVFAAFSILHPVKFDWAGAPWVAVLPALAFGIADSRESGVDRLAQGLRRAWTPMLLALLLFYGLRFYYFATGVPGLGYGQHPDNVPVGWRELAAQIHAVAERSADSSGRVPLVVGMDRNFLASELAFYAPDPDAAATQTTSAHLFGQTGLMYAYWFPPAAQRGRRLLLVGWRAEDLDSPQIRAGVEELAPIHEAELRRNGSLVRRYYYRIAEGYRGLAP